MRSNAELTEAYGVPCTLDSDGLLAQLRRLSAAYRRRGEDRIEELIATFNELDERLSASGQLPEDWKGVE